MNEYAYYKLTKREYAATVLITGAAIYCFAYLFYRSPVFSMIVSPMAFLYPRVRSRRIAERKRSELKRQFRDMLYSMSSSLMAGKPLESAFLDVRDDLEVLYPDDSTPIRQEVALILRRIALNESVEEALNDLADRSKIDDIESFCNVLSTCKRTGGNLVDIVRNTSNIIGDKLEIKQEIDIMLAARRLEKNILNATPSVMILILSLVAADYIEPVFTTTTGRVVMTVSIFLMLVSWFIAGKISNISV